jgi:hypothetical protein
VSNDELGKVSLQDRIVSGDLTSIRLPTEIDF